jgi:hypothetical protein
VEAATAAETAATTTTSAAPPTTVAATTSTVATTTTTVATTTTTANLGDRTKAVGEAVRGSLCSGLSRSECQVDDSVAGVVEITAKGALITESRLRLAGVNTGMWASADVARMQRTRALDGTQRTSDGKVSWTYHPDSGLVIIIDVR